MQKKDDSHEKNQEFPYRRRILADAEAPSTRGVIHLMAIEINEYVGNDNIKHVKEDRTVKKGTKKVEKASALNSKKGGKKK